MTTDERAELHNLADRVPDDAIGTGYDFDGKEPESKSGKSIPKLDVSEHEQGGRRMIVVQGLHLPDATVWIDNGVLVLRVRHYRLHSERETPDAELA